MEFHNHFYKLESLVVLLISTRKNIYEHERFVNKLEVSLTEYISNPWGDIGGDKPLSIEVILKLPKSDFNIMVLDSPTNSYNLIWDYDVPNNRGRLQLKKNDSLTLGQTAYIPYLTRRDCCSCTKFRVIDKPKYI